MTDARSDDELTTNDAELLGLLAERALRGSGAAGRDLKQRILSAARTQPFAFIHEQNGIWLPSANGSAAKALFHDASDRATTRLVRVPAGAPLSEPPIDGAQHIYVLAGALRDARGGYLPDDFATVEATPCVATADSLILEFASARREVARTNRAATATWDTPFPGARVRPLLGRHDEPQEVFVLDLPPGMVLAEHQHVGLEELYVLSGNCVVESEPLARGDYHRATAGTHHQATTAAETGCRLVVAVRDLSRLVA